MSTAGTGFREVAGLVNLTPTNGSNNGVTLRVPYYFVPKAISQIEVKIARLAARRTVVQHDRDGGEQVGRRNRRRG